MAITRLAPSPTGALHLGNARTFLVNWLLARQNGWQIILRIDDLDGPRVKAGADQQALEDLAWLGLDWDGPVIHQSSRRREHQAAIDHLLLMGQAYPCVCSRSEVERTASAPHADDGASIYPGTCRDRFATVADARKLSGRKPAIRLRMNDGEISFQDRFAGLQTFSPAADLGDFVIAKADGTPAYQLACVVDDTAAGVTHVIRGDDLLDSTPRQIAIHRALGLADKIPNYYHVPLVRGADGKRLAKRHGDTRLRAYRAQGIPPSRVLALLAQWIGINPSSNVENARDLRGRFDLSRLHHTPIMFGPADEAFLATGK